MPLLKGAASEYTTFIKANANTLSAPNVQSKSSSAGVTMVTTKAATSTVVVASKISATVNPVKSVATVSKATSSKNTGK
uniref:Uncharacterized protein n=1 Tax=viral metagenome TaxID=1070528 RepID=A0A6C0JLX4_9ZZZZ